METTTSFTEFSQRLSVEPIVNNERVKKMSANSFHQLVFSINLKTMLSYSVNGVDYI
jgi:hypothetical protein